MEFNESLQILGIEKYSDRILNSNSHGELLHLADYICIAETLGKTDWFAKWFEYVVEQAEREWKRPESVFQHIAKLLKDEIESIK